MKTLIALSMLLIASVSFAKSYEGSAIITIQQDVAAKTPNNYGAYEVGITMGAPNCIAGFSASRPFTLKKGTKLQVTYRAAEKEAWADGDDITSIPTNASTNIAMSYKAANGDILSGSAGCSRSGTLFPKRGLPTLNELLEKASPLFTIELQ